MMNYRKLHTYRTADIEDIQHPVKTPGLTLDSSAQLIFTDFQREKPLMLEQGVSIDHAVEMMKSEHARLKLVIDHDEQFRGVITLADLLSVKVMQACERTGLSRSDLSISQIMTSKKSLWAIDFDQLLHANIGDVLTTMQSHGEQHVLVIDNEHRAIRGIISASDIAQHLQLPVMIKERATSFADIFKAVNA